MLWDNTQIIPKHKHVLVKSFVYSSTLSVTISWSVTHKSNTAGAYFVKGKSLKLCAEKDSFV